MKLAILKVILWPKDPSRSPRVVTFEPGKINVVTGGSSTGKSTLSWIIDYCLGSNKCSIPVGLIRNVTAWFGLHIRLANTEMIIARRNPEGQQTTTEMYWIEGLELTVPPVVSRNARVEDLKNRLNQISQLPSLDFSADDNVGFGGRPSCRDMAAFNFQPQHIVANPYTLFFKADTTEHREKLRFIFPLVLGAIDANTLAKQRELRELQREYEHHRRELDARLAAAHAWEAEVAAYYLQAKNLGLLPDSASPDSSWQLDKYVLELQKVPDAVRRLDLPDVREGTNEAGAKELTQLINQEDNLGEQLGSLRRRLSKLDQLSSSVGEYGATLTSQEDRLQGVGWFEKRLDGAHVCPVCGTNHREANPHLAGLKTLARELSSLTASVRSAPPKLDLELATLRQELRERESAITEVRQKRRILEDHSAEFAAQRQRIRQVYLFVGRVEQALDNVSASRNVGDLREKVKALEDKIAELKRQVDPRLQQERLRAAIDAVSAKIASYAARLQLEHSNENVRLNTRELTLQFSPLSGRTDFLWEVGSGQNWVGYHIAAVLALHEHFRRVNDNPVPEFLVVDQPSQVYFPEAWPSMDKPPDDGKEIDRSSDIDGVRRIFSVLSHFLETLKGEFQVIVTEHAGSITWDGIPNIHVVGNWRRGHDEFLIPEDWL